MKNNEFTKLRKERGGNSRPSFFTIIIAVVVGVLFVLACIHSGEDFGPFVCYAAEVPANSIEQTAIQSYYEGNGSFHYWSDNKQKHYVNLHSYPPSNNFSNITDISYQFVNINGDRLYWRFIGYKNGSEVYRSGLAAYGEKVNINEIDIDSYDVYAINYDDEMNIVDTGEIRTAVHTWTYKYYVELPTEKEGTTEDITTTEYISLEDFTDVTIPAWDDFEGADFNITNFFAWVGSQWYYLLAMRFIGFVFTTCIIITFIRFIMRGD